MSRQLADLLLKDKIITQSQYGESIGVANDGRDQVRFLIESKYVAETKLLYYLSQKFGLPSINLTKFEISPEVIKLIPPDLAQEDAGDPDPGEQGHARRRGLRSVRPRGGSTTSNSASR